MNRNAMQPITNQQTVAEICRCFGISELERNRVIFATGEAFAAQFSQGEAMTREKLFWEVWVRIFTADDKGVLKYPKLHDLPYQEVKKCMANDATIKREFCKMYYGSKGGKRTVNRQPSNLNQWRKRLIAAIGGWLTMTGKQGGLDMIKGVACRAAGVDDFNKIPKARLVSLYNAFVQKQKDLKTVNDITQ